MTRRRQAIQVRQDRPFKGRQFTAEVILWAVRWYLMFPISYRDLELMLLTRDQRSIFATEPDIVPAHKASPVQLSSEHERELRDLVRAHSTPQRLAQRARIILLAAAGLGVEETAQRLGIWRKTANTLTMVTNHLQLIRPESS
jgi:DNA-binding CsgD family transcriptional regulator